MLSKLRRAEALGSPSGGRQNATRSSSAERLAAKDPPDSHQRISTSKVSSLATNHRGFAAGEHPGSPIFCVISWIMLGFWLRRMPRWQSVTRRRDGLLTS